MGRLYIIRPHQPHSKVGYVPSISVATSPRKTSITSSKEKTNTTWSEVMRGCLCDDRSKSDSSTPTRRAVQRTRQLHSLRRGGSDTSSRAGCTRRPGARGQCEDEVLQIPA